MHTTTAYIAGLSTGAGLIIAIGAQNAFVLTQSIRKNHALPVAGLCALLDALLIAAGVLGLGTAVARVEALRIVATFGGAAFLAWFGARSLRDAIRPQGLHAGADAASGAASGVDSGAKSGLWPTLSATLAVSLLNPHVYLDTVIMLGAISGNYAGDGRYLFGAGAATASVLWFFTLCFAGRALAPVFTRPGAWRVLHLLVTAMVWRVAFGLLYDFFSSGGGRSMP